MDLASTIGKYEFSISPRSLFSNDGLLLIPTDKSSFMKVIEGYSSEPMDDTTESPGNSGKVCIIDAMEVVQCIKKGPKMETCGDFADAFLELLIIY